MFSGNFTGHSSLFRIKVNNKIISSYFDLKVKKTGRDKEARFLYFIYTCREYIWKSVHNPSPELWRRRLWISVILSEILKINSINITKNSKMSIGGVGNVLDPYIFIFIIDRR